MMDLKGKTQDLELDGRRPLFHMHVTFDALEADVGGAGPRDEVQGGAACLGPASMSDQTGHGPNDSARSDTCPI
jgi:hypothetical protein